MVPRLPRERLETHDVTNQPEAREALRLWADDAALRAIVDRHAPAHTGRLQDFAGRIGAAEGLEAAEAANRNPPELRIFDSGGRRIDEVAFHPAYHALMATGTEAGYSALPWRAEAPGGHAAHAAMVYLLSQVEPGVCCPLTMTYAAVPALAATPSVAAQWRPGALSCRYDPRPLPAGEKAGLTFGMAMTEKQGGSDVRANTTRAVRDGEGYRLTGHKWFCSAPMSDAFLTLAQLEEGLTCFLVPLWQPDGTRNPIHLMRLKDKLGNRANASAEIEYHGAWGELLGEPGRGIATIIEMVHHTRLDTALAPAGLMRRAIEEAHWWARHRRAFGGLLADKPLMQAVLADLALEWLAALSAGMRVAAAFDRPADAGERALARVGVALAKYHANSRCGPVVLAAMECLGGSGYVEESVMPRLYREAPLNAIWEGSGNVICLDVLRSLERVPEAMGALEAELGAVRGASPVYDAALAAVLAWIGRGVEEMEARRLVERLALLFEAAQLLRHADGAIAEAFVATRLGGDHGQGFGTLPKGIDPAPMLAAIAA